MQFFRLSKLKVIFLVFVGLPALLVSFVVFALMSDPCAIQGADPESYPEVWTSDHPAQMQCKAFSKCSETGNFLKCYWQTILLGQK
jgi:hypothetical protein